MSNSKSLCFLVYNEFENLNFFKDSIKKVIIQNKFDEIFAIDRSNDGSKQLLVELGINVINQKIPGRGSAMIEALNYCKHDYLVFFSPDGNEDIDDLSKFNLLIDKNQYDLIIASRMMDGAINEEDKNFFKPRKLANNFFNYFANIFFNKTKTYITDSINGYRAININKIKKLNLMSTKFTVEYEMTIKCFKNNLEIYEFPTIEKDRYHGKTKAKSLVVGFDFLRCLCLEVFNK